MATLNSTLAPPSSTHGQHLHHLDQIHPPEEADRSGLGDCGPFQIPRKETGTSGPKTISFSPWNSSRGCQLSLRHLNPSGVDGRSLRKRTEGEQKCIMGALLPTLGRVKRVCRGVCSLMNPPIDTKAESADTETFQPGLKPRTFLVSQRSARRGCQMFPTRKLHYNDLICLMRRHVSPGLDLTWPCPERTLCDPAPEQLMGLQNR